MAHLSLDGEPLIKPSIGKLLGRSNDKKLSRSTVFAAVYPDSDNEGTENYIEGTENYSEGTETTPEKLNGLMVNIKYCTRPIITHIAISLKYKF